MNFKSVCEFVRLKSLGISLALIAALAAFAVASRNDKISPVTISLVLGVLAANTNLLTQGSKPGIDFAARKLLRLGVILLGFRLALGDLQKIGSIKG
ncbi:MAG: putative sulfate exporter family transporter, partial [Acidimicrobiales bacterium]